MARFGVVVVVITSWRRRESAIITTTHSRVATCLSLFALITVTQVQDQRIGSVGSRGVSGGERKRTAVANELVTAPSMLFLDEPTSGLDSTTALLLVQTLRSLCDRGMTIVCCIHQPRENIFMLFDRLLLLASGRTSYFGPSGSCREYLEVRHPPCCYAALSAAAAAALLLLSAAADAAASPPAAAAAAAAASECHR